VTRGRAGIAPAWLVLLTGVVATGCGGENAGPLAAPGRGRTFAIEPVGPGVRIGAPGGGSPDRLAARLLPLPGTGGSAADVEVRFEVERGGGRVARATALTDAAGVASVPYVSSGSPDSTRVRIQVVEDPGAAIRVEVLARPAFALAAAPGSVLALPRAGRGVLLEVPAGATVDLVPYDTSPERGRLEYALRSDEGVALDAAASPAAAPRLVPAIPSTEPAETPPAGAFPDTSFPFAGDLPKAYDVANCELGAHRFAPLARAGRALALYVDAAQPPDPARLSELVDTFDAHVAPLLEGLFGGPVDLDGNGRVLAVMSHAMRPDGGVYCGSVQRRGREVLYTAWDPDQPAEEQLRVLAHEYQHVINASQHFRWDRAGRPVDEPWLNEGFSQVAEWKAGYPGEDLRRVSAFLARMNASLPLLAERRGSDFVAGRFLFALWLGDRFGDAIYRALGQSGLAGRENVERVTGVPFRDILRDWFVTLALSDAPPAEPAWRYRSIELAGEAERGAACGCLPAGRLTGVVFEPLRLESDLAIVRTLDVQDADFFRVTAGERPAALYFHAGDDPDVELFAVPH
jgi:hypothetical protein